jgi:hypothetical protein
MAENQETPAPAEHALSVYDLLGPARDLDYNNPEIQYALDCEAERRLRLRGLLGPAGCKDLRQRIIKKFRKDNGLIG